METLSLENGGKVEYFPNFLTKEEADQLFETLKKEIPWNQVITKYGPAPRLNAWNADEGINYDYTGVSHAGKGWHPACQDIRDRIAEKGYEFNSLLLNYYRDGSDSIGKHTDAEPSLGLNPVVASLSLGVTRKFILSHMTKKEGRRYLRHELKLEHGALLVMGGTLQHFWKHELPKEPNVEGERISLTFRKIVG